MRREKGLPQGQDSEEQIGKLYGLREHANRSDRYAEIVYEGLELAASPRGEDRDLMGVSDTARELVEDDGDRAPLNRRDDRIPRLRDEGDSHGLVGL